MRELSTIDRHGHRGNALLGVLLFVIVLGIASAGILMVTAGSSAESAASARRQSAMVAAEAGIHDALVALVPTLEKGEPTAYGTEEAPIDFPGGRYWVSGEKAVDGTVTLVSTGSSRGQELTIETVWGGNRSLKDYAIYAGNKSSDPAYTIEFGGAVVTTTTTKRGVTTTTTTHTEDIVNGDIYADGDVELNGDSVANGDVTATGQILGNAAKGTAQEKASVVPPPNLGAMHYESTADFSIDGSTPFNASGQLPEVDPRHIFVKDFRSDLATSKGFRFDNTNYFLGDPYENKNLNQVSVSPDGNNKVYYVDGNLWIEPQGTTSSIVDSPPEGTVITVVVKGNIYFSDTLEYDDPSVDGLLFVAMSDGESYTDLDGDNQYDVGEPLLHDDGDGTYEGVSEGSGNIYFGDPNGGPLGHVHGFMYAENHFEDHVLDTRGGTPLPFAVTGFMSAGEQVRIARDLGKSHAQMVVNYDSRIQDGTLLLPGFPGGGGGNAALRLLHWQIVGSE